MIVPSLHARTDDRPAMLVEAKGCIIGAVVHAYKRRNKPMCACGMRVCRSC